MAETPAAALRDAPDAPLLVGLSGGLDSSVLLHALAADAAARARGLRAIHVRHDLQPAAAAWAKHCAEFCAAMGVELQVVPVQVRLGSGLGLEGAAREARHAAFAAALAPAEVLVLAHHRDDQAETVLLRLLRASGSGGLGAMRGSRLFAQGRLWRPMLELPRAALLDYAKAHGLRWIDDPSNADADFDRNFLRHRVLPVVRTRWPGADAALARSAALLAEDAALLAEEAESRLQAARTADPRTLSTPALCALSPAWRARVLRHWLASLELPPLPGRACALIDAELLLARRDAQPEYRWAGARLRRWRELLHVDAYGARDGRGFSCRWDGTAPLPLPDGASLELQGAGDGARLPPDLLPLRVLSRTGGERIRLPGRKHTHALKDCLLQAGLPPWLRERVPLLQAPDAELLAAGDAVVSGRWQEACTASGLRLRWHPGADA